MREAEREKAKWRGKRQEETYRSSSGPPGALQRETVRECKRASAVADSRGIDRPRRGPFHDREEGGIAPERRAMSARKRAGPLNPAKS
jgi:hypothetical protein